MYKRNIYKYIRKLNIYAYFDIFEIKDEDSDSEESSTANNSELSESNEELSGFDKYEKMYQDSQPKKQRENTLRKRLLSIKTPEIEDLRQFRKDCWYKIQEVLKIDEKGNYDVVQFILDIIQHQYCNVCKNGREFYVVCDLWCQQTSMPIYCNGEVLYKKGWEELNIE